MIWLYIFAPVFLIFGIALYFGKKTGMTMSVETRSADKLEEYPPEHGMNSHNPM